MTDNSSQSVIDMGTDTLTINRTVEGRPIAAPRKPRKKNSHPPKEPEGDQSAKAARLKADPYIWGTYILLVIVAIVELFSASTTEVTGSNVYAPIIRHGIFLGLGLVCILCLQKFHYAYIGRFASLFALVSIILLFIANTWGANINGAQRAIMISGITIQPAEIVKLAAVIILAKILSRNQQPRGVSTRGIIMSAGVVGIFAALTFRNGFTNMAIIMGTSISMLLIGGIPMKKLTIVAIVYLMLGGMFMLIKQNTEKASEFDLVAQETIAQNSDESLIINNIDRGVDRTELRENRIKEWMKGVHPDDELTDNNRQVRLSYMAQARGGVIGKGPGNSRESARLPLAFSDYIFSIIVEDTGLIGGICLMILYLCLVARAGVLAYRCKRAFPAFLIMGCAVLIVFQALVHMAIVTGACPVSGQPLPLISKGGTSVVIMSCAIGVMLSVSRYATLSKGGGQDAPQAIQPAEEPYDRLVEDDTANITTYNELD